MRLEIKLVDSESQIRQLILNALKQDVQMTINKSTHQISDKIKALVKSALMSEPEYASLMGGQLKAEFGIESSSSVDAVVEAMVETISITQNVIKVTNIGLSGGFTLTMMKSDDMGGVINQKNAQSLDSKGYALPWLEWLLFRNNEILVRNYKVKFGQNPYSRSGMAIMIPSDTDWRVPPAFVGSVENNWTTRAIDRVESQILNTIIQTIKDNV